MKDKELMIGIPTRNHSQYIQYYLAKVLPIAQVYNIDIIIYDSSTDNDTYKIVNERMKSGYNNLFYKRYNQNIKLEEKIKDIFINSGYEYVWLCGDGIVINLEKDIQIIQEEISNKRDLIIFNIKDFDKKIYTEYTDSVKLLKNCWASLTLFGASIIKGNLFKNIDWNQGLDKYRDFVMSASIFDIFLKKKLNAVLIVHNFFEHNPYKRKSTWQDSGRSLEIFAGSIVFALENLPVIYDNVKKDAMLDIDKCTNFFGINNLWSLKVNGNLNLIMVLKYRKQLKKVTLTPYWLFIMVSVIPNSFAKVMMVVNGSF